jgi:hypothetical protein
MHEEGGQEKPPVEILLCRLDAAKKCSHALAFDAGPRLRRSSSLGLTFNLASGMR